MAVPQSVLYKADSVIKVTTGDARIALYSPSVQSQAKNLFFPQ